jgi:hypothetical protein
MNTTTQMMSVTTGRRLLALAMLSGLSFIRHSPSLSASARVDRGRIDVRCMLTLYETTRTP